MRTFACCLIAATITQNVINLALGVVSVGLGVEAGVTSNEGEESLIGCGRGREGGRKEGGRKSMVSGCGFCETLGSDRRHRR